jgi:hypothetical protein
VFGRLGEIRFKATTNVSFERRYESKRLCRDTFCDLPINWICCEIFRVGHYRKPMGWSDPRCTMSATPSPRAIRQRELFGLWALFLQRLLDPFDEMLGNVITAAIGNDTTQLCFEIHLVETGSAIVQVSLDRTSTLLGQFTVEVVVQLLNDLVAVRDSAICHAIPPDICI